MPVNTQKISVYSLMVGMFVYKLDKPWADTAYPLEGFYIKTQNEIRKLKLVCRYVYIDQDKSTEAYHKQQKLIISNQCRTKDNKTAIKKPIIIVNKQEYSNVIPFKKALKKAINNHQQLQQRVDYLFSHVSSRNIVEVKQVKQVISSTIDNMIDNPDALMWVARTRENDDYTYNFVLKQTIWALATARQLGMNKADMEQLALASILSGIGKSKLPTDILKNENKLNAAQFSIYKKHIAYTVNIVEQMKDISPQVIRIVKQHCEYIDGSGYPNKLKGDKICLAAQIIGLAAFYEINNAPRDLSRAISANEALDKINYCKAKKFNAELVESFVQAIGIYPTGTLVQLSNGEIAVIVESKEKQLRLQPNVIVLRNTMDEKPQKQHFIKLSSAKNNLKIVQSLALGSHDIDQKEINEAVYQYNHSWSLKNVIGF